MDENRQTVLLTGACGHIGRRIREGLRGKADIICCDMSAEVLEWEEPSHGIYAVQCDLCVPDMLQEALAELEKKGIRANRAVLAHGRIGYGRMESMDYEGFREIFQANLDSCFHVMKVLIPQMKEMGGGNIVIIASQFGRTAAYDLMAYCASKAALIQWMRCVALDYAEHHIIINSVSPGILSGSMGRWMKDSWQQLNINWKLVAARLPIGEIAVDDIIDCVVFLLNQKSMTGEDIVIDGGYTIR